MTGSSPSDDVASDLIDAYLTAVENALLNAGAPRADRMQVLQNLEEQITEMLVPHPLPFTEEAVRAVLDKLEPASHFAATYGSSGSNSGEATSPAQPALLQRFRFSRPNWPFVAAATAAILVLGGLFAMIAAASGPNDFWIFMALLFCFVGIVVTPIALWKAYRQLRSNPAAPGRDLVLRSAIAYGTLAPILLVLLAAEATNGAAPMLIGAAAFVYAQYHLVRRLWTSLAQALPQPPTAPATNSAGRTAPSSVHPATPMPAM